MLWAITHSIKVTGHYLTKTLRGPSHLFLVSIVEITVLQNSEITAQQNQIDVSTKLKKYRYNWIVDPGAVTPICHTLGTASFVSYLRYIKHAMWTGAMGCISPVGHMLGICGLDHFEAWTGDDGMEG